jgi:hypothetical protein
MVNITRGTFNYDDESWAISSESYIPPTNLRTNDSSEEEESPKPPKPEQPPEKE